jgi:hypothetical protein
MRGAARRTKLSNGRYEETRESTENEVFGPVADRPVTTPSGLNGAPRAVMEWFGTGHSLTTLRTSGVS